MCPQHDVLWGELTADEHIELLCGVKGVAAERVEAEAEARLRDVNLLESRSIAAGSYSGGMRRRLSISLAFIGDPSVVFLDEPTTGMDPVSRRHVWDFIERSKRGRTVMLTTHSMEEATRWRPSASCPTASRRSACPQKNSVPAF